MIRMVSRGVCLLLVIIAHLAFAQRKKDAGRLFEDAETAHDNGRYLEALDLLNECITINPGFVQAYYIRGSVKEQLNDPAGALTDYSIYLETNDQNNEAHLARGILHFRQGHFGLARDDFYKILTSPAGVTNTIFYRQSSYSSGTDQIMTLQSGRKAYLLNYIGLCETKLKEFPKAIIYFDSAISIDSKDADYFVNRGIAKEGLGDSTARDDYQKALALDPVHGIARHNLSVLQSVKGDKAAAENMLTDLIDNDSTMLYAYRQRAYQRLDAGYFKGALEDYNEALKIDQTDPELYLARGIAKEKLKDLNGAFSDYTKAIDLKENMEKAWLNRGNVLAKLNRLQDAIEDYTVALTYFPDFPVAYYNRGIAKFRLKLLQEACDDILKAWQMGFQGDEKTRTKICGPKN